MGRDELVADWVRGLIARVRSAYRARRRERARRCIRCGAPATMECTACGALACDRCWLPSIETGEIAVLCLDCTGSRTPSPAARFDAVASARSGAVILLWILGGIAAWVGWRQGPRAGWRFVATLLDPGILLGLVPLAFLLGALRSVAVRSLDGLVRSPSKRSS